MNSEGRDGGETSMGARRADLSAAVRTSKAVVSPANAPAGPHSCGEQGKSSKQHPTAVSPAPSTQEAFAEFRDRLNERGLRDALGYLVGISEYRFIGIFRFQAGRANAVVHVDRENPEQLMAEEVPDTATYCCYIRDTRGAFATANAALDPRLNAHAARDVVSSYCGVPIMDPEGNLLGTLCHYDVVPRDPERLDLELLLQVASAIEQSGQVPPYPNA